MTRELTDNSGATVTVALELAKPISAYTVSVAGERVGRADFIDSPDGKDERIFFHTEVNEQFGGRGLGGLLVREALAGSMRENLVVVPVCPLFGSHLKKHGDEFLSDGGAFRNPTPADIALVKRVAQANS